MGPRQPSNAHLKGRSLCSLFCHPSSSEPLAAPCDGAKPGTDASVDTDKDSSIHLPVFLDTHWPPVSSESGLTSSDCVQAPARPNSVLSCLPPQSHLY